MSTLVLVAIILLVVANAVTLFIFARKFGDNKSEKGEEGMRLLLTQLNELNRSVDQKMGEGNKTMHEFMSSQSS